jgi:hypothetical protein
MNDILLNEFLSNTYSSQKYYYLNIRGKIHNHTAEEAAIYFRTSIPNIDKLHSWNHNGLFESIEDIDSKNILWFEQINPKWTNEELKELRDIIRKNNIIPSEVLRSKNTKFISDELIKSGVSPSGIIRTPRSIEHGIQILHKNSLYPQQNQISQSQTTAPKSNLGNGLREIFIKKINDKEFSKTDILRVNFVQGDAFEIDIAESLKNANQNSNIPALDYSKNFILNTENINILEYIDILGDNNSIINIGEKYEIPNNKLKFRVKKDVKSNLTLVIEANQLNGHIYKAWWNLHRGIEDNDYNDNDNNETLSDELKWKSDIILESIKSNSILFEEEMILGILRIEFMNNANYGNRGLSVYEITKIFKTFMSDPNKDPKYNAIYNKYLTSGGGYSSFNALKRTRSNIRDKYEPSVNQMKRMHKYITKEYIDRGIILYLTPQEYSNLDPTIKKIGSFLGIAAKLAAGLGEGNFSSIPQAMTDFYKKIIKR